MRTKAQRLERGFHRVGLVLAAIPMVAFFVWALMVPGDGYRELGARFTISAVVSWALYAAVWAIGWIIRGFMSDPEEHV